VVTRYVILYKFLMAEEHPIFAVDRHHITRPGSLHHNAYVFLRSMARNVDQPPLFFDDIRTAFVQVPYQAAYRPLIARDDPCRKYDRVTLLDLDPFIRRSRHIP